MELIISILETVIYEILTFFHHVFTLGETELTDVIFIPSCPHTHTHHGRGQGHRESSQCELFRYTSNSTLRGDETHHMWPGAGKEQRKENRKKHDGWYKDSVLSSLLKGSTCEISSSKFSGVVYP